MPKREEITGCRQLPNKERHDLYYGYHIKGMRWAEHVWMRRAMLARLAYLKRSLQRPRHTWVNNIKTELQEIAW